MVVACWAGHAGFDLDGLDTYKFCADDLTRTAGCGIVLGTGDEERVYSVRRSQGKEKPATPGGIVMTATGRLHTVADVSAMDSEPGREGRSQVNVADRLGRTGPPHLKTVLGNDPLLCVSRGSLGQMQFQIAVDQCPRIAELEAG